MPTAPHPAEITLSLLARYRAVRQATASLCKPLSPEDLMVQSCPEASPVKWHLAHTSWFFETMILREFAAGYQPFHPDFHWLFNSYYNSLGEIPEKKLRSSFSRPPLDAILAYRAHVDTAMHKLMEYPLEDEAARRIALGLEHEQQHQELIATDIKHALFTNPLHPAYIATAHADTKIAETIAPPVEFIEFAPGLTDIGLNPDPHSPTAFAFDNETPAHKVYIAPYRIANRLVTCSEYLAFIEQNGYQRPELWLSEGWDIIRDEGWLAPLYWRRDENTNSGWSIYTMHGFRSLDDLSETPVCHLSFFEADAFARWAGHRLPTEFEWEHAASTLAISHKEVGHHASLLVHPQAQPFVGSEKGIPLGADRRAHPGTPGIEANLLDSGNLHPTPARPISGLQQFYGDVWEWTASPYTGYPGYRPLPGALGEYNGKFMSSQMVLRGGSAVTPATHIRLTYRNFFSPGTRWQFSGLRLAQDTAR